MRRSQAPSQVQPNVGTPTTPRFNSPFKLGKPKSLPATLSTTPSKPRRLVVSRA
ncbi:hypothetical protein K7432_015875 [Basidiobolus ranarum]|uniref:Uncharacterized protein n=1 Tax=Basidiobolus ranarum TaxID=34480 RepID=A0ABR2VMG7_9FUNG